MNSRKHADTSVGGAVALAKKPAAKPQPQKPPVYPVSTGIPWDEIRRRYPNKSHSTHPRDLAA